MSSNDLYQKVALLAEGVDRNLLRTRRWTMPAVALLAEGVDRNFKDRYPITLVITVALLAEGVDRNGIGAAVFRLNRRSPSSRRAWIEIRMEVKIMADIKESPSSRRAWIEIVPCTPPG